MVIMAVDPGEVRTGVAVCEETETFAFPKGVVTARSEDELVRTLTQKARELGALRIVVGLPKNMDGSSGARARASENLARRLEEAAGLPVDLYDERCTTLSAHVALNATNTKGKKRKAVVDAVAAVLILEDYLRHRKNQTGGLQNG